MVRPFGAREASSDRSEARGARAEAAGREWPPSPPLAATGVPMSPSVSSPAPRALPKHTHPVDTENRTRALEDPRTGALRGRSLRQLRLACHPFVAARSHWGRTGSRGAGSGSPGPSSPDTRSKRALRLSTARPAGLSPNGTEDSRPTASRMPRTRLRGALGVDKSTVWVGRLPSLRGREVTQRTSNVTQGCHRLVGRDKVLVESRQAFRLDWSLPRCDRQLLRRVDQLPVLAGLR